jgi:anaerobic ribonucleoside-triphosphate reductase
MIKVPVECWSRIVGYYRPLKDWNRGKRQEFEDRTAYQAEKKAEREAMTCKP